MVNQWGEHVRKYKYKKEENGKEIWVWRPLEGLNLGAREKEIFENMLLKRKVNQMERKEKIIWGVFKDGRYSVKKGYDLIIQSQIWEELDLLLRLCWDSTCLPKDGIFLWITLHKRILKTKRLKKIGFEEPSRCI